MAYGTVKVDNVTFTYNAVDATTTFSGFYASTTNNLTLSGTASAATFTGTTANFTNVNAQNISVTTALSGLAITGGTAGFTTVTGTTVTGTTASFTSGVFTNISGTTATFTSGIIASGTAALPSLAILSDPNTGIFSPGADQLAVATNGVERVEFGNTEVVFNDGGANYDFRIEGDAVDSLFFVDASADKIGIGSITALGPKLNIYESGTGMINALHLGSGGGTAGNGASISFGLGNYQDPTVNLLAKIGGIYTGGGYQGALTFHTNANSDGTSPTERARIDSSGRLLVGTSSTSGNGCLIQARNDSTGLAVEAQRSSDNASAPTMFFTKSRGTQGSPTEVSSGDQLGVIAFSGYDGAGYKDAAYIIAECDGTWTDGGDTTDNPARLVFSTTADGASTPTERMRIKSDGNVLIGTTSDSGRFVVNADIPSNVGQRCCLLSGIGAGDVSMECLGISKFDNNSTASQIFVRFYINNGTTGSGQINANGGGAAAFGSYSDERLKENIVDLPSQYENIKSLRPVEFDYREGGGHQTGFIAQEMQRVYPDSVSAGSDEMLMLTGWSKTEARLVKALQEAIAKIETLEAKVAALESA